MSTDLTELLESNRRWAAATEQRTPGFFTSLLAQQAPQYLWIGCADSRVPANEILGLLPGDVFVHRNVANVVVHSDLNALSVMQFAIDMLQVRHVMVVGHYGCGGVAAALHDRRIGIADNWIRHVPDVRNKHREWLDEVAEDRRLGALCELNVLEQALMSARRLSSGRPGREPACRLHGLATAFLRLLKDWHHCGAIRSRFGPVCAAMTALKLRYA